MAEEKHCCCCEMTGGKTKVRTDKEYKDLMNRLKRIEGQVRGIQSTAGGNPLFRISFLIYSKISRCLSVIFPYAIAESSRTSDSLFLYYISICICNCIFLTSLQIL